MQLVFSPIYDYQNLSDLDVDLSPPSNDAVGLFPHIWLPIFYINIYISFPRLLAVIGTWKNIIIALVIMTVFLNTPQLPGTILFSKSHNFIPGSKGRLLPKIKVSCQMLFETAINRHTLTHTDRPTWASQVTRPGELAGVCKKHLWDNGKPGPSTNFLIGYPD